MNETIIKHIAMICFGVPFLFLGQAFIPVAIYAMINEVKTGEASLKDIDDIMFGIFMMLILIGIQAIICFLIYAFFKTW